MCLDVTQDDMNAAAGLLLHSAQTQVHLCHVDAIVVAQLSMMLVVVCATTSRISKALAQVSLLLPK